MAAKTSSGFHYRFREDGFHEIVFTESSPEAFDIFLKTLGELFTTAPQNQRLNILLDFRPGGFPPLYQAFKSAQPFFARHPYHPQTRFAFIHQQSTLSTLARSLFDLLRLKDEGRFFAAYEAEEAVMWMLQ